MSRNRSRFYTICEVATEAVIYFMVIFSPWAFGTTQRWSIWTLNFAGFLLGGILVLKLFSRWLNRNTAKAGPSRLTIAQAALTVLILAYCLISILNARATYDRATQQFVYRDCIRWLPHTYDIQSSWFAFWNYLALALSFWAIRDWLLEGKGRRKEEKSGRQLSMAETETGRIRRRGRSEEVGDKERIGRHLSLTLSPADAEREGKAEPQLCPTVSAAEAVRVSVRDRKRRESRRPTYLPRRWQRLFWVLCLNGALLGVVCLIQRIDGAGKLLWLVEPRINNTADAQFGPYAYRSNAAQYFNLLWPACLGFWWMLHLASGSSALGRGPSVPRAYGVILPCALLMAACAIASLSRGGALVAVAQMVAACITVVVFYKGSGRWGRVGLGAVGVLLLVLFFSGFLDWNNFYERFAGTSSDITSGRGEIYRNALVMAQDFWLWGSGPQTFSPLYQLYFWPRTRTGLRKFTTIGWKPGSLSEA